MWEKRSFEIFINLNIANLIKILEIKLKSRPT